MRKALAALTLGLMALGSSTAHADSTITTDAFGITMDGVGLTSGMQLLSNTGGTARIDLDLSGGELWSPITVSSAGIWYDRHWLPHSTNFDIDLHDGYRITSIALSGTIFGSLDPGVPPPAQYPSSSAIGEATNEFSITLRQYQYPAPSLTLASQVYDSIQGDRAVLVASDQVFYDDLTLNLSTEFEVTASSGAYFGYGGPDSDPYAAEYPSTAMFGVRNLMLTIQVAPVPEPSTWAMLVAGAGLLAFTARRRKA
jgi:hypothetical protein